MSQHGPHARGGESYERALAIARELGDTMFEGAVLGSLANLLRDLDQADEAQTLYGHALAIHREVKDRRVRARRSAILLPCISNREV